MKNNKGLTLVELIAVLVVLTIVGAIAVPNVIKKINEYYEQMYQDQIAIIEAAANTWAADHTDVLPTDVGDIYKITYQSLQEGGYLDSDFKSVMENQPFSPTSYVEIRCTLSMETNYQYEYTYVP